MKYLKIAALFSLINAIFFGVFLYVLYSQSISLKSRESTVPAAQQAAGVLPDIATTTKAVPVTSPTAINEAVRPVPGQSPAPAPKVPPVTNPAPVVPPPIASNRCIVTISGQHYDVTNFRDQHSGGDVFVCGTDMTQTFFGRHNQQLLDSSQMASLKVP